MDKAFIRNFAIFVAILVLCSGSLIYSLIRGDHDLGKSDDLVMHTQDVITEAEQLSTMIEGMLAAQRGFIITGNDKFLDEYEAKKAEVSEHVALLSELISDNLSQESRLDELRSYFTEFSRQLEERAETIAPRVDKSALKDVQILDNLKDNIIRVNKSILKEQYQLLNERFYALDEQKSQYLSTLLISVLIGTALLLVFNGFLLHAQRKRSKAEASLKDTEERFALAIDGMQDGVFDWDIKTGKVFYSRRFFEMLGYDKQAYVGSVEDSRSLLHPDDADKVWSHVEQYINGQLSEYKQEFRMKHNSGRWVWVKSRAKALYDKDGKAYRMVGAHSDISYTVKTQERLEADKEAAESANRAKSEFLAHMSHEIRTPLTAISGIAEILEKTKGSLDEKQQKLVGTLTSSTSSLKDLIDDILDFSKIENAELELDEQVFSLDQLFEEVISMMSMRASEKGISFVLDYQSLQSNDFYGDQKRLRQILVNLISNAIKFTNEGAVTVKADSEERDSLNYMRIDVIDTGIGIEPENFDLVFERFKQADSSVSRRYGGTGLGLPISRNLARLMGGDIFLSSQAGKGSTFSLLLPMKIHSNNTEVESIGLTEKLNSKLQAVVSGENKILIVEDYEGNVVVISYILEEIGADYDVARNGLEALNLWKKNHYDIVLMDIQMPEMDGFTATREIRDLERTQNLGRTPIIGMTAHALVGDKDKCIAAGMDAYLPKPIVEADLKRQILKFLEQLSKAA